MQVHRAGNQFLAGSGLSGDEDRGGAGGNARQKQQHLLHARTCDDELSLAAVGCHASPQLACRALDTDGQATHTFTVCIQQYLPKGCQSRSLKQQMEVTKVTY